jgi:hypothetical protein
MFLAPLILPLDADFILDADIPFQNVLKKNPFSIKLRMDAGSPATFIRNWLGGFKGSRGPGF